MEFYVKDIGEPRYQSDKLQQDEELTMLLTQIETILFTRKGEVLGDENFGANLEDYVYALSYNDFMIKKTIKDQLKLYVPLAKKYNVQVEAEFTHESDRHVMFVDIVVDSKIQLELYI